MSRIRTIKPDFWSSEQVMECSRDARLLFIGLWNFADDFGRYPYNPRKIKAVIFPGDDDTSVEVWLKDLISCALISIYEVDGKTYLEITGWHHQKIDKRQPARFPNRNGEFESPSKTDSGPGVDHSKNCCDKFDDHSTNTSRLVSTERKGIEKKERALDSDPTLPIQIENSTKALPVQDERATERPSRKNSYPADFEGFWNGYPTDPNMSKKEAFVVWRKLSTEARKAAIDSVPGFVAYCKGHPDYRPVHACRYLSKDRAAGHLAAAEKVRSAENSVYVKRDTPQWSAWSDWYFRTKGQGPPTDTKGGWYFPSPWPPSEKPALSIENHPLPQLTN